MTPRREEFPQRRVDGAQRTPSIAVIVPVLNEAAGIGGCVTEVVRRQDVDEIVVVDGHSADGTAAAARGALHGVAGAAVIGSPRGRAAQMNAGAARAQSDVVLFLHADTRLPAGAAGEVRRCVRGGAIWGRFDVRLNGEHRGYRVIERAMNLRSRISGIATGDQCMFVRRSTFVDVGGFADIALMEDIEISKRLKRLARPARITSPAETSTRRWEARGVLRTVALMWWLRARYFLGADPQRLAARYHGAR